MLLYNASTFGTKRETSNNNNIISKDSIISHGAETETGDISSSSSTGFIYDDGSMYSDQRQQFEVAAGMHRALLEASLKVRKTISFHICMEKVLIPPAALLKIPPTLLTLKLNKVLLYR